VHPSNLADSCGKCHPGASENFVKAKIHVRMEAANVWTRLVRNVYVWLIILIIGAMLIHNALDFGRKMINRARAQRQEPHVIRMTRLERVTHLLLILSFSFLAYTGFALMFPDAWWVAPLNWISQTEAFRSTSHRVAGVVLTVLMLHHIWFLFFHRVGREQFKRLLPRLRDFRDLWHNLLFFVGKRQTRARFGRFGYVEKAEYWALVWGTAVMVLTGFILWFEDAALSVMPLWLWEVFNIVHRYEAILAVSAVVVWHFYYVLVNPEEAPMSLTWITGKLPLHDLAIQHPEEYEEVMAGRRQSADGDPEGTPAAGAEPTGPASGGEQDRE
jgi:formate dehydrogenase gamma subunit